MIKATRFLLVLMAFFACASYVVSTACFSSLTSPEIEPVVWAETT
jgi:hypothetical protein